MLSADICQYLLDNNLQWNDSCCKLMGSRAPTNKCGAEQMQLKFADQMCGMINGEPQWGNKKSLKNVETLQSCQNQCILAGKLVCNEL